jgi:hypothetical protein
LKFLKVAVLALCLTAPVLAPLSAPCWAEGKAYIVYQSPKSEFARIVETAFKQNKLFEQMTERINKTFRLQRDLTVVFGETGQPRAWYDADHHRVMISYEMIQGLTKLFSAKVTDSGELDKDVAGCVLYTAYHEMGRALINELDLPTTGPLDDAGNELSAYLLARAGEEAGQSTLAAAKWFKLLSDAKADEATLATWDDQMPDPHKLFDAIGLVYGSDPNRFVFLETAVPEQSLQQGLKAYPHLQHNWDRLLMPYVLKATSLAPWREAKTGWPARPASASLRLPDNQTLAGFERF